MRPLHVSRILERELAAAGGGEHTPVMLWGPPGVGKSDLVRQAAAANGVAVIDLRLAQMEPSDLRGIPFRADEGVEWAPPTALPRAERDGEAGVLFLDELTAAPPAVSAAAYQLILDRRLGAYTVPPGWALVAAGNRQGDRGVSYTLPTPLANRFTHYEIEPHLDDWVAWAHQQGVDERLIAFLRFRPERLFEMDPAQGLTAFPSPRSWLFAHRALGKFAETPDLVEPALAACVGEAAAVELTAYLRSVARLPDLDAIIAGEAAPVPDDVELQYAVATGLVARARAAGQGTDAVEVYDRVLRYAQRLPQRELGVMLVCDLHRAVGATLFEAPAFGDWADEVADLLLYHDAAVAG